MTGPPSAYDRGVFVLVKTSNPSAGDVQDMQVDDGRPLYEHLGRLSGMLGRKQPRAEWLFECRCRRGRHLARAGGSACVHSCSTPLFLVPGYGAQGATAADVAQLLRRPRTRRPNQRLAQYHLRLVVLNAMRAVIARRTMGRRHARLHSVWVTISATLRARLSGRDDPCAPRDDPRRGETQSSAYTAMSQG